MVLVMDNLSLVMARPHPATEPVRSKNTISEELYPRLLPRLPERSVDHNNEPPERLASPGVQLTQNKSERYAQLFISVSRFSTIASKNCSVVIQA